MSSKTVQLVRRDDITPYREISGITISDKELIALGLAAEATGIDSELYLFTQLPDEVKNRIERSVYNRRRQNLSQHTQRLQQRIADIIPQETYHLIDSMPL